MVFRTSCIEGRERSCSFRQRFEPDATFLRHSMRSHIDSMWSYRSQERGADFMSSEDGRGCGPPMNEAHSGLKLELRDDQR